jgi:hypothetical protein
MAWSTVKMGIYRPAPGRKWQGAPLMCVVPMPPKAPHLTPYGHRAPPEWLSLGRDGPKLRSPSLIPFMELPRRMGYNGTTLANKGICHTTNLPGPSGRFYWPSWVTSGTHTPTMSKNQPGHAIRTALLSLALREHLHRPPCHALQVLQIGVNWLWPVIMDEKGSVRCVITTFWVMYHREVSLVWGCPGGNFGQRAMLLCPPRQFCPTCNAACLRA